MRPATALEVIPAEGALGAEIRCGDRREADGDTIRAIREAWLDHLVVLFRDQRFTDSDLVVFGARFGDFQYSNPLPSPLAWDNRCVMHRREPFDPNARRILHRVVIKGTKPFFQEEHRWQT